MAEFDDDMVLGQLRDLLRNRSTGSAPRSKPDEFKANDLPEFSGGADPEAYLEWERKIERLFDFKELTDEKRCKYAILRLSKGASLWYEGVKKQRARAGKEKITSWESLKRKLRKRFVPNTHKIATYRKIAELKQGKSSIGEYIDEFEGLSLMGEIEEVEEQKMARFLRGMHPSIAHSVELYPYSNFDTLCSLSTKVEAQGRAKSNGGATTEHQLTNPWAKSSPRPSVQDEGSSGSMKTPSRTPSAIPKPSEASRETSLSRMRCFKCQGFGHLQNSCPNRRIVTLKEAVSWKDEIVDAEEEEDQIFGSNEEATEDIEEFEAPPHSTNLVLRVLQEDEGADDQEKYCPRWDSAPDDHSGWNFTVGFPEQEASRRITLQGPDGNNWQAEISEATEESLPSAEGSNCVEDHSLKEHEFLPFGYNRVEYFNVMILDTYAGERQDWFERKKLACSLPISSTYSWQFGTFPPCSPLTLTDHPYDPQQNWLKVPGLCERIDWAALNKKFGLPSAVPSFGSLLSDLVLDLRSFGLRPSSVVGVRLPTFGPPAFGRSPRASDLDPDGTFCEKRAGWVVQRQPRHVPKKLICGERRKSKQHGKSPGFKEEPPPSDRVKLPAASTILGLLQTEVGCSVFGLWQSGSDLVFIIDCLRIFHPTPSTFGTIVPGYLLVSTTSVVDFIHFKCASGSDDRAESRTIPSKEEEMMRIWNTVPKSPRIMTSKNYRSRFLGWLSRLNPSMTEEYLSLRSATSFYKPNKTSICNSLHNLASGFGHFPSAASPFGNHHLRPDVFFLHLLFSQPLSDDAFDRPSWVRFQSSSTFDQLPSVIPPAAILRLHSVFVCLHSVPFGHTPSSVFLRPESFGCLETSQSDSFGYILSVQIRKSSASIFGGSSASGSTEL